MELAIFLFFVIILAGAVLSLICVAKLPILLYHESNGERCLLSALRNLPGNPYFFRNLYLPTVTGRTTEIDLVMVHESGIYVFESKDFSGWIFGSQSHQYWTQTLPGKWHAHKTRFFNPLLQNAAHIRHLRRILNIEGLPYYSYIVFSNRCVFKDIHVESGHTVLHLADLRQSVIKQIMMPGAHIPSPTIESICRQVESFTNVPPIVKQAHIEQLRKDAANNHANLCPCCGAPLIRRIAKRGPNTGSPFWGCSRYPDCRFTKPYEP